MTKSSDLVFDAYLPGALVLVHHAHDNYSAGDKSLDGAIYDNVWRFYDSEYDDCAMTVTLPCSCMVRVESTVNACAVSNGGGIGHFFISKSLSDPTATGWANRASNYWVTRSTQYHSAYAFGLGELAAGEHSFRPVWMIQTPHVLYMRFQAHLTLMAWKLP